MGLENLPVYVVLAYGFYEILAGGYNLERLSEGKKLKRISSATWLASSSYPKEYFKNNKK
jgi:hypothetical protein